mmetsp:Transcript_26668/g.30790  ORF Transcript_26668/g.30790 Transcript_26668/m.30790 type:complete len:138 (-) Transcript_26668:282-695(-)
MLKRSYPMPYLQNITRPSAENHNKRQGLKTYFNAPNENNKLSYQLMRQSLDVQTVIVYHVDISGENIHLHLRCDQVKKTNENLGRTHVADVMSNAKLQQCPGCKKRFLSMPNSNNLKRTKLVKLVAFYHHQVEKEFI